MDLDITKLANGGFSLVMLAGLVWFLKWLFIGEKSGVNRFMDGWSGMSKAFTKLSESSEKIGESVDNLNQFMRESLARQSESLDVNAVSMERQERAGVAFCQFLKHEVELKQIPEDSKSELKKKIDEIEKGLTR